MSRKQFQIGAGRLALLRKEELRHHAQRYMDHEQSLWWQNLGCSPNRWQRKARPCSKEESSAINHGWAGWQENGGKRIRSSGTEAGEFRDMAAFFCPDSLAYSLSFFRNSPKMGFNRSA